MRYKIVAKEWGTQAQKKKSDVAHLNGLGRSDGEEETRTRYKIKVTERGIQAQKEQKEKCSCVRAGERERGANGIKIKVIELPETQIYTDSIDHRLKQ